MVSENNHSVQGNWMGNYYYQSVNQAHAFEVVFLESKGLVDGSVLDDGHLGEARVSGSFTFPKLSFVKKYDRAGLDPVRYEGTMDDDGKRISGTWTINVACSGTFIIWRSDDEELDEDVTEHTDEVEVKTLTSTSASR